MSVEQGLSTTVRRGEVETVEFNRDQGFGITLYVGQRKGSASTTGSGDSAIRETVAAALAIARHASEDEFAGLADASLMAREVPDLDLYHPWNIAPEQAIEQALACEAAAFAADPRIRNADGTSLNTHQGARAYGNSNGFIGGYCSTRHSLSCVMIAEADGRCSGTISTTSTVRAMRCSIPRRSVAAPPSGRYNGSRAPCTHL